jgi:hypothetical protein
MNKSRVNSTLQRGIDSKKHSRSKIFIDPDEFKKSFKGIKKDFPQAFAMAIKATTEHGKDVAINATKADFDLTTNWVLRNLGNFPSTRGQVNKIANDLRTKKTFWASVEGSPRIWFLFGHDEGVTRYTIKGRKYLAVPQKDLLEIPNVKTPTGKIRSNYTPGHAIRTFRMQKPKRTGSSSTVPKRTFGKGVKMTPARAFNAKRKHKAFLIRTRQTGELRMVARRFTSSSHPLYVYWRFIKRAEIKDNWRFTEDTTRAIERSYRRFFEVVWSRMQRK